MPSRTTRVSGVIAVAVLAPLLARDRAWAEGTGGQGLDPVAQYLRCPSEQERQAIDKDFDIRFTSQNGWDRYPYSCDLADKNPTRAKIYKVIQFVKDVSFSRPLPFTEGKSAYDFLRASGSRQRVTIIPLVKCGLASTGAKFTINVNDGFTRWYPIVSGTECAEATFLAPDSPSLASPGVYHPLFAASVLIHEGRHAISSKPHTRPGGRDATIDEMGAWAAVFYYMAWIGLYSTNADAALQSLARATAADTLDTFGDNYCPSEPTLRDVVRQIRPRVCFNPGEINPRPMEFVRIEPGEFMMGCSAFGKEACSPDILPQHRVQITVGFEIAKNEVTQSQWESVMGWNVTEQYGADLPIDMVSWLDVQAYLGRLNQRNDGFRYRLPTEAEWEYAARAGNKGIWPDPLDEFAWSIRNSSGRPQPVGQKRPNAWGLHDTLGSVGEFVQDWYGATYYSESPAVDPLGPRTGTTRVYRSSSWLSPYYGTFYSREAVGPDAKLKGLGVRVVRERVPPN